MATIVAGESMDTFPDSAIVASGGERSTTEKPATDDATLLEKTQKATKQGKSSSSFFFFALAHGKILVEFYFADANLPYDKSDAFKPTFSRY